MNDELLANARAVARFLARETGLQVGAPRFDEERGAVILPFQSLAGREHRIALAADLLAERSPEELQPLLRENWVPDKMKHPAYETLLVTSEGIESF